MSDHNILFDRLGHTRGLGTDHNLLGGRGRGLAREEGGMRMLGQGVGVQVVVGRHQAGHLVGGSVLELSVSQVDPLGHAPTLSVHWATVEGVHLKAQGDLAAPGEDRGGGGGGAHLVQALLLNTVPLIVGYIVEQPEDAIGVDPSVSSLLGPIRVLLLLPVLTRMGLEPEEPVGPQVSLYVVLC